MSCYNGQHMNRYNPKEIEPKWQKYWEDNSSFRAADDAKEEKNYVLDMFPYPSANGLHVGHPEGYTATDILSRYRRMKGFNVLHPMGWDAFGLPAENFAIKTGVHPDKSTHGNITNFTRQIKSLGFSYDWEREIDTSSPEYYRWTQWMFLQMFKNGLAYKKKAKVNWCNTCQTVLANEQVIDGKCERSKDEVIQKDLEQWFFKTTQYADRLIDDLDTIDWPEPIKLMQRNWIGKSNGAELSFTVKDSEDTIDVFTTRPDTLFGATYIVLAPEHPLVRKITTADQKAVVEKYLEEAQKKSELERTDLAKEKSGVFTGAYAINPANNEEIPVWIAEYVLIEYGTGAIMAVPAHDERDYEFAKKYDLKIVAVVEGGKENNIFTGDGKLIASGEFDGMDNKAAKAAITKKMGGKLKTTYRLRDWLISRQRYWGTPIPIVYDPEGNAHPVKEEHLPLKLPTDVDYTPKGTSPLGSSESYKKLAEDLYGEGWYFEIDTMDTFVCSSWYYLRYCDPQNDKAFADPDKLKQWLPVDMYVGGAEHAVLHLLYARFFHKVLQDFGHIPKEVGVEPFAALRNQGMILAEDNQKMSKSRGNVINPDEVIEEHGADTLRLYEMFMGPFEDTKPWNTESIKGTRRFLERVFKIYQNEPAAETSKDLQVVLHKTIQKVTEDIENFKFNTAIAQMMVCSSEFQSNIDAFDEQSMKSFLQLVQPFAPHLAAELAELRGFGQELFTTWPTFNPELTKESSVIVGVQVNGKIRGKIDIAPDASEEDAQKLATANRNVARYIEGKDIMKFIYIPGKIVNIVVKG